MERWRTRRKYDSETKSRREEEENRKKRENGERMGERKEKLLLLAKGDAYREEGGETVREAHAENEREISRQTVIEMRETHSYTYHTKS